VDAELVARHLDARIALIRESFDASVQAQQLKDLGIKVPARVEVEAGRTTPVSKADDHSKPKIKFRSPFKHQGQAAKADTATPDIIEAEVIEVHTVAG
jgi:hypothetical protein